MNKTVYVLGMSLSEYLTLFLRNEVDTSLEAIYCRDVCLV